MISPAEITEIVCSVFNVSQQQLQTRTRIREIVKPRQIAIYFIRINYPDNRFSLAAIARMFNLENHATILHACNVVHNLIETNDSLYKHKIDCVQLRIDLKLQLRRQEHFFKTAKIQLCNLPILN